MTSTLTQTVIDFLIAACDGNDGFRETLASASAEDDAADLFRMNVLVATVVASETQVPAFFRLVVCQALASHVDWSEVASFFSASPSHGGSQS